MRYLLYFLLLSSYLYAEEKNLNIYTFGKKYENYVDIYLVNNNPYNMSVTLKAELQNLKPEKKLPVTGNYEPFTTTKMLRLYKIDKKKKWKYNVKYKYRHGKVNQKHDDSYLYRLPYKLGTVEKVSQGMDTKLTHKGISRYAVDFKLDKGTKLFASRGGTVLYVKEDSQVGGRSREEFYIKSNHIGIEHSDGTISLYSHLQRNGAVVDVGDRILRGDHIGYSGNTGFSSGPHLHFAVYTNVDGENMQTLPIKFITKRGIVRKPKRGDKLFAVK